MNTTFIKKCTCSNATQDKLHGTGMRLMNLCKLDGSDKDLNTFRGCRCTVCGKVYPKGD